MASVIDASAQFAGQDAADALLPHFKALKRAGKAVAVDGLPFPKLSFILRVDGEVRSFGFTGPDHVDVDRKGKYVSVDIGISTTDRERLGGDAAENPIVQSILGAVALLSRTDDDRLQGADFDAVEAGLRSFCSRYLSEVAATSDTSL